MSIFRKDIGIHESFVVKEGLFAETSRLFVVNKDGTFSLYSYPKCEYLSGSDTHSKAFLKDNFSGTIYDITRGDNLYNFTGFAYNYYNLCNSYKDSLDSKSGGFDLNISNLYDNPNDAESLEKIEKYKKILRRYCLLHNVSYEKDPSKIMERIVKRIEDCPDRLFPGFKEPSVLFCTSKENIDSYCDSAMAKFNTTDELEKFSSDIYGMNGTSGRIVFKYFGHLLSNQHLLNDAYYLKSYNNSSAIIKEFMEFLIAFPYFSTLLKELSNYSKIANKKARELKFKDFYSHPEFIDEINNILESNQDGMLRFHAATDEESAKRIVNEGLYAYSSNIDSTTIAGLDLENILEYGYGNGVNMYDKYVVVVKEPLDEDIVRELTAEEKDNANVYPRRLAVIDKPGYIVDRKYIIGYIDKKNKKVIYNPVFEKKDESVRHL